MMYRRIGTQIVLNVTNPDLIPLYEGNEAYEVVEDKAVKEEKATEAKKTTTKKK